MPELIQLRIIEKSRSDWEDRRRRETEEFSRRIRDADPAEPDVFERLEAFSVGHQQVFIAKRCQFRSHVESRALERGMLMSKAALEAKSRALEHLQRTLEDMQRALKIREQQALALQRELENQRQKRHGLATREVHQPHVRQLDETCVSIGSTEDDFDCSGTWECERWLRGSLSDAMSTGSNGLDHGVSDSHTTGHGKTRSLHKSCSSDNSSQTAGNVGDSNYALLSTTPKEEHREGLTPQTIGQRLLHKQERRYSRLGDKRDGIGHSLESLQRKLEDVEGSLAEEQQFRQLAEDGVKVRLRVGLRTIHVAITGCREDNDNFLHCTVVLSCRCAGP